MKLDNYLSSQLPPASRKKPQAGHKKATAKNTAKRSPRARLNVIPDAMLLEDIIKKARAAFSRGLIWDRGAILNLLL